MWCSALVVLAVVVWSWIVSCVHSAYDKHNVASHLRILIPVGTAMIIVADVKYARVSTSIPTVNMWRADTTNPNSSIASKAKNYS